MNEIEARERMNERMNKRINEMVRHQWDTGMNERFDEKKQHRARAYTTYENEKKTENVLLMLEYNNNTDIFKYIWEMKETQQ